MPLPNKLFFERLADMADATLLCDLMDITSEDIIERFEDLVLENITQLREVFDISFELEYNEDIDEDEEDDNNEYED
jgi:hypothetical protein